MQNAITRSFQIDRQECLVHVPNQPNGYLVLYLGDAGHYVEHNRSFWEEHTGRSTLLQHLLDEGYTLYTSHLYGNHWGSQRAVELLNQVYHRVVRQEIVNPYIHVIAEGMGALAILKWQEKHKIPIRSLVLLTPCVNVKALYAQERTNQLYFKRLKKEMAASYETDEKSVDAYLTSHIPQSEAPMLLFHDMANALYSVHEHSRRLEEQQLGKGEYIDLKLAIQPLFPRINRTMTTFMKRFETSISDPY